MAGRGPSAPPARRPPSCGGWGSGTAPPFFRSTAARPSLSKTRRGRVPPDRDAATRGGGVDARRVAHPRRRAAPHRVSLTRAWRNAAPVWHLPPGEGAGGDGRMAPFASPRCVAVGVMAPSIACPPPPPPQSPVHPRVHPASTGGAPRRPIGRRLAAAAQLANGWTYRSGGAPRVPHDSRGVAPDSPAPGRPRQTDSRGWHCHAQPTNPCRPSAPIGLYGRRRRRRRAVCAPGAACHAGGRLGQRQRRARRAYNRLVLARPPGRPALPRSAAADGRVCFHIRQPLAAARLPSPAPPPARRSRQRGEAVVGGGIGLGGRAPVGDGWKAGGGTPATMNRRRLALPIRRLRPQMTPAARTWRAGACRSRLPPGRLAGLPVVGCAGTHTAATSAATAAIVPWRPRGWRGGGGMGGDNLGGQRVR